MESDAAALLRRQTTKEHMQDNRIHSLILPAGSRRDRVAHGGRSACIPGLDFSVCVNPFPPAPSVLKAAQTSDFGSYPDARGEDLITRLTELHGRDPEELILTNGASQAIFLTAFILLKTGRTCSVVAPCYGEYAKNSLLMGAEVTEFTCREEDNFLPDMKRLEEHMLKYRPSVLWLCNPVNPTGVLLDRDGVEFIADISRSIGGVVVIDEAYMNFVSPEVRSRAEMAGSSPDNLLILRSMTKDFSLPGLRLGYAVASRPFIDALRSIQPEWSLNSTALAAGAAALEEIDYYQSAWRQVRQLSASLQEDLRRLDYTVYPGKANFTLLKDESRGGIDPKRCSQVFSACGAAVRDCTSLGLRGYLRIGTSLPQANETLLDILAREDLWSR